MGNPALAVRDRALAAERVRIDEALPLLDPAHLFNLLSLGRDLRSRRSGLRVSVPAAAHPEGATGACPFCEFLPADGDATAEPKVPAAADSLELHALPPWPGATLGFERLLRFARDFSARTQGSVLSIATPRGIAAAAARDGVSLDSAFGALAEVGIERLRGGEPLELDESMCMSADSTLDAHRAAHRAGIQTDLAVRYVPPLGRAYLDFLDALRIEQGQTRPGRGGFAAFVTVPKSPDSTGLADLQAVALARLLLDNIPLLGVAYRALTEKLAPLAAACGGDFLAVVAAPRSAGSPTAPPDESRFGVPIEELRRLLMEVDLELHVGLD